jgi:hypothetical protein
VGVTGRTTDRLLTTGEGPLTMPVGGHHEETVMAALVHRAGRGLGLVLGTTLLAACAATPATVSTAPAHRTAVAACTDALGEGWQVTVEMDRANSSTLALVSGDSIATCQTWSNAERTDFGNTVTGVGLHPTASPPALSFLTSGGTADKTAFLVGRVPASASAVRVTFADGSQHDAVLGGGLWLDWPEQPGEPTAIEALDAAGTVVSRLADANGIQPAG